MQVVQIKIKQVFLVEKKIIFLILKERKKSVDKHKSVLYDVIS